MSQSGRPLVVQIRQPSLFQPRAIDRDATGTLGAAAFKDGTIGVSVGAEEVDVQKPVRAAEEVNTAKAAIQKTRTVSDTVWHETVNVQDNTADPTLR